MINASVFLKTSCFSEDINVKRLFLIHGIMSMKIDKSHVYNTPRESCIYLLVDIMYDFSTYATYTTMALAIEISIDV